MADLPPYRTPRWVKIVGIITLVLVLLVGIMLLTGIGGDHGPGRHMPSGNSGGDKPRFSSHKTTARAGGPAASSMTARSVEVATLDPVTFASSRINVSVGGTVTFRVTNTGQTVHEFAGSVVAIQQKHAVELLQLDYGMTYFRSRSSTLPLTKTQPLTGSIGNIGMLVYGSQEQGHTEAGLSGHIRPNRTHAPAEVQAS